MTNPQLWIAVVENGCFFALLGLAFYFNLTGAGFFNFGIGAIAMAAAFTGSWLVTEHGLSRPLAGLVGVLGAIAIAVVMELAVVRPVQARGEGELSALVAVGSSLFAIIQLSGLFLGHEARPGQPFWSTTPFSVGSARVGSTVVPIVVITAALFTLSYLALQRTRLGRLTRAIGNDTDAARVLGLPINTARLLSFAAAGLIAALAGITFAGRSGVSPDNALHWTITGFLALVIGGTGTVWAPLLGGALLALANVFIPFYFGGDVLAYGLVVVAMLFFAFRPEGVFAPRVRV